jgi:hypothetical protein
MNKFFSSALLLLTASTTAQASLPVGTFGHEFTAIKNAPVWSVRTQAGTYNVLSYGGGIKKSAHVLTRDERIAFWSEMAWTPGSHEDAECIGNTLETICYVPTKTRKLIPALQSQASDFFHFDKTGGIMEIQKISGDKNY